MSTAPEPRPQHNSTVASLPVGKRKLGKMEGSPTAELEGGSDNVKKSKDAPTRPPLIDASASSGESPRGLKWLPRADASPKFANLTSGAISAKRNTLQRASSYDPNMMRAGFQRSSLLRNAVNNNSGNPERGDGEETGDGPGTGTRVTPPSLIRAASAPAVMMHREQFFQVLNSLEVNMENRINAASTISAALRQQFNGSTLKTIHQRPPSPATAKFAAEAGISAGATAPVADLASTSASASASASTSVVPDNGASQSTDAAKFVANKLLNAPSIGRCKSAAASPAAPDEDEETEVPPSEPMTAATIRTLLDIIREGEIVPQAQAQDILRQAIALFDAESTVVYIDGPTPYDPATNAASPRKAARNAGANGDVSRRTSESSEMSDGSYGEVDAVFDFNEGDFHESALDATGSSTSSTAKEEQGGTSTSSKCLFTVVGDTHGQLRDLLHIIDSITGLPGPQNVLVFNGDMVDRGTSSCEIFLIVCALKVYAPQYVAVNRGNHEAFGMGVHGFTKEALKKYDMQTYDLFQHAFRVLPLATVLSRHTVVLHGGLGNWDAVRKSSILGDGEDDESPAPGVGDDNNENGDDDEEDEDDDDETDINGRPRSHIDHHLGLVGSKKRKIRKRHEEAGRSMAAGVGSLARGMAEAAAAARKEADAERQGCQDAGAAAIGDEEEEGSATGGETIIGSSNDAWWAQGAKTSMICIESINAIDRKRDVPAGNIPALMRLLANAIFQDVLWSDPGPQPNCVLNPRGAGVIFGPDITAKFLRQSGGLQRLVRSHECVDHGIQYHHNNQCVTVFSASDYCGQAGNLGAVFQFTSSHPNRSRVKQFMTTEVVTESKEGRGSGGRTVEVVRWRPGDRQRAERDSQVAASHRRLQLLAMRLKELIIEDKKKLLTAVAKNYPPKTKTLPVREWGKLLSRTLGLEGPIPWADLQPHIAPDLVLVKKKPHVQLEHFFAKYGVRLPENWTQKIIGVYKQNLHHLYATQSLNEIFMERLTSQKSRASKCVHWTDLQQDLKAVFPKLQLTTDELKQLIYDITQQTSRNHITREQFLQCFFPEVYPNNAVPDSPHAEDSTIRLRRTFRSVTMAVSEFPSWLRVFLLEFGRAVRNLLSRFSVLKIFAALDHDKDGEINIEDLQQSIHELRLPVFNDREKVAQVARVMGRNEKGVVDFEHFVAFIRTANQTALRASGKTKGVSNAGASTNTSDAVRDGE